ncbi:MAG: dihydrofolate reductase family protein [Actinomycetota bacterium]|nr:dihydrofolate reductase family protein [Actinomycetota bacterium]
MQILTRLSISVDGYVTTPDGWPVLTADPAFVSGRSHGFPEFQQRCEAVLMGRTTFEPALANDRWPWPALDVFVLGSNVPTEGAPVPIVTGSDPARLLEKLRAANRGGNVHLVGGPQTIETFRALGALDKLGLLVIPVLLGDDRRLTPTVSTDTELVLESERSLPEGSVEIVYACK